MAKGGRLVFLDLAIKANKTMDHMQIPPCCEVVAIPSSGSVGEVLN